MKILCSLAFLFLISITLHAQTWQWTHPEPNGTANGDDDIVHVTAVDAQRNVYALGDYNDTLYLNNVVRAVGQGSYVAKYDSLGNLLWYQLITASPLTEGPTNINATDMVINSEGIFITGGFGGDESTLYQIGGSTFGNYPDSAGQTALFFCKMDFNGNVIWNKTSNFSPPNKYYINGGLGQITSGSSSYPTRLATDNNGNVFLGGWCDPEQDKKFTIGTDVIPIKPQPENSNRRVYDMFIVKYNSAGNLVWSQYSFDSCSTNNSFTNLNSMICDGNGNLFINANINNNEKFGSITYKSFDKTDQIGICLIKIPSSGGWSFVSELTTYTEDSFGGLIAAKRLACDNSNNVYALVNVSGNAVVGTTLLRKKITTPYGWPQPYLVKMDNNGNALWSEYFDAVGVQEGASLGNYAGGIYYSNNQLFITGSVLYDGYPTNYLAFSKLTIPFVLSSVSQSNYFVAKCDTAGNFIWATNFGGSNVSSGYAICTDSAGNVYTGGLYYTDIETLGNLNGSFTNTNRDVANTFFGKLKDQYIHIDSLSSTAVCPGSNVSIPFHSYGLTFSSANTFTAELSDSTGSFSNPKAIGSVKSTGTGSITATIPASFPYAHGYIVRIKSSDTLATGYPYYTYADTTYKITLLCPAPSSGFAATNIKSTSATLNWNPVSCAKGYKLQYRKTGTTAWKTVTVSTNIDSTVISGLTAATTYQWHVATKCANNQFSAYSIINTFTTAASLNEFVGTIAFTSKNALGLTVVPNPAQTNAVLVSNDILKDATVAIMDIQGKPVWKITHVNGSQVDLPVQKLASGVYVVHVFNNNQISVVRFVKE